MTKQTCILVLLAAGSGNRMGKTPQSKQFLSKEGTEAGDSLIEECLVAFHAVEDITHKVVVLPKVHPLDDAKQQELAENLAPLHYCTGGASRLESMQCAISSLIERGFSEESWLLVHDAARPQVHPKDISALINAVLTMNEEEFSGGILAQKITDTVKQVIDGKIQTIDRTNLWRALTPQMFRLKDLKQSPPSDAPVAPTDDSMLMEQLGKVYLMVNTQFPNNKITTQEDWLRS